jgi:hypothetical protein
MSVFLITVIYIPYNTVSFGETANEELQKLYSSPRIIRIIKSRRVRWAEHVARVREKMEA